MVQSFAFMRQSTDAGAQLAQLALGVPEPPQLPPQSQPAAYSSGAPKMWPVSCAKTRSMLSGPQPSLSAAITSRGPPIEA